MLFLWWDTSKLKTGKITTMEGLFMSCAELTSVDVSQFETNNVVSMRSMFNGCAKLRSLNLENFDTSKVTDFDYFLNQK